MKGSAEPIDKPRCNCAVVGIYGNRHPLPPPPVAAAAGTR